MSLPSLARLPSATLAIARAQPSTMTVVRKDGSRHSFRLADVARIEMAGAATTANYSNPNGRITAQRLGAEHKSLTGYWFQSGSGQRCLVAREGTFYWGVIRLARSTGNVF